MIVGIIAGLLVMGVIALGPVISMVLNHLAPICAGLGAVGLVAIGTYTARRIRSLQAFSPEPSTA